MKIKDLPQEIKELALKYQVEQGNEPNEDVDNTSMKELGNFDWTNTKEGHVFWQDINRGNFAPFYELYPQFKSCDKVQRLWKAKWETEIFFYGFYNPISKYHVVYRESGTMLKAENVRPFQAPIQITESEIKRVFAEIHKVTPEMIEICK